jgi:hypothetical protein
MGFWIKNSDGKPDAVLTMALVGFAIVLVKVLASGVTFAFQGVDYNMGSVDASTVAAILTPTLGSYVARKYTDKKFSKKTEAKKEEQDDITK